MHFLAAQAQVHVELPFPSPARAVEGAMAKPPAYFLMDFHTMDNASCVSKGWYLQISTLLNLLCAKDPGNEVALAVLEKETGNYSWTYICSGTLSSETGWEEVELPSAKTKPHIYKPPAYGIKWMHHPDGSMHLR